MDSMRNLSTSLPNSGRRRTEQPELLAEFRAAAASVTNLYTTARSAQERSRAAGYQDALDDLLAFLDEKSLGLMDGEGWKVRQWATERLDDGIVRQTASDDEEENGKEEEAVPVGSRSSSPETQRNPAAPVQVSIASEASPHRRVVSEPPLPPQQQAPPQPQAAVPSLEDFTFRSSHAYPTNHDREGTMDLDASSTAPSTPASSETVRIIPRSSRARHNNHNRHRGENRTLSLNLGAGAGSKRKIPYPEFFDIDSMDSDNRDRREGGGRGGKRRKDV